MATRKSSRRPRSPGQLVPALRAAVKVADEALAALGEKPKAKRRGRASPRRPR
ncbi:MAG: hypothetical protein JSR73_17140 [Proteobacteria bacterium]|nr:hypothetical protein [Pseudomonadota bacterium]